MLKRAFHGDIILPMAPDIYHSGYMRVLLESLGKSFSAIQSDFSLLLGRWDDLEFNVSNLRVNPSTSKPDYDFNEAVFLFDAGSTETVRGSRQFSHEAATNGTVYPHLHWIQENAGVVKWQLEYKQYKNGEAIPATWTTMTTINQVFPYTSGSIVQISSFGEAVMPAGLSDIIVVRISRLGADAQDTYTGDAKFLSFDIHYQNQSSGSKTDLR